MRTNEEFKQLVTDKYKILQKSKKDKRRRALIWGSNLLVCVILCTVFLQNGVITKVFAPNQGTGILFESEEAEENSSSLNDSTIGGDNNDFSSFISDETYPTVSVPSDSGLNDYSAEEDVLHDTSVGAPDLSLGGESCTDEESSALPEINTSESEVSEEDSFPNNDGGLPPDDVPEPIPPTKPDGDELNRDEFYGIFDMETRAGVGDFAFDLFVNSYSGGENNLISPTAAIYSLSMLANGANGDTQTEMVNALCEQDLRRLNCFVYNFRYFFAKTIEGALWFESTVKPSEGFLQTNKDYYGVEIYSGIETGDINDWFTAKNRGLTDGTAYSLEPNTKMVSANTVFIESSWTRPLAVMEQKLSFNCSDKTTVHLTALQGYADGHIITDDCVGIIKNYKYDYKFAAFMPTDGQTLQDLIAKLDYKYFSNKIVYNAIMRPTKLIMPRFEATGEHNLRDAIIESGINDAFNGSSADFDNISDQNIYMTDILQRATLSVNENGSMNADKNEAYNDSLNPNAETITFDKPFVYVIYEKNTHLPIFIGTVENFENTNT